MSRLGEGQVISRNTGYALHGFCCGWLDGPGLSPGHSPGSRCYYGQLQLQALAENVFVFSVPVQLAH